jgi:hypothetical protein
MFSSPAAFLARPVEPSLKYLKMTDFRERPLPEEKNGPHEKLMKK